MAMEMAASAIAHARQLGQTALKTVSQGQHTASLRQQEAFFQVMFDASFPAAKRVAYQLYPNKTLVDRPKYRANLEFQLRRIPPALRTAIFAVLHAMQHPVVFNNIVNPPTNIPQIANLLGVIELAGRMTLPSLLDNPQISPNHFSIVQRNTSRVDLTQFDTFFKDGRIPRQFRKNDFVIVGSGPGGIMTAHILHEKYPDAQILIIEEGDYYPGKIFGNSTPIRATGEFYSEGGVTAAIDLKNASGTAAPTGKAVGGSMEIFSTTAARVRTSEEFELYGLSKYMTWEKYQKTVAWVEEIHDVAENPQEIINTITKEMIRAAQNMPKESGIRNAGPTKSFSAHKCGGLGKCPVGCDTGGKETTAMVLLPALLASGKVGLVSGAKVTQTILRSDNSPKAVKIFSMEGVSTIGIEDGIISSAGTFGSPVIVHNAGIRLPMLGKKYTGQAAFELFAFNPNKKIDPPQHVGKPQSGYIEVYNTDNALADLVATVDGFIGLGEGARPATGILAMARRRLYGTNLRDSIEGLPYTGVFGGVLTENMEDVRAGLSGGNVYPGLSNIFGQKVLTYSLSERDRMRRKLLALALLKVAANTPQGEYLGIGLNHFFPSKSKYASWGLFLSSELPEFERYLLPNKKVDLSEEIFFHPMGSMGDCVDNEGKVIGSKDFYVIDGSLFKGPGVNPTISILTVAAELASKIKRRKRI